MRRAMLLTLALALGGDRRPGGGEELGDARLPARPGRAVARPRHAPPRRRPGLFRGQRRLGNRVYPDDGTPGIAQAYNCGTKTLHRVREGALDRGRTLAGRRPYPTISSFAAETEKRATDRREADNKLKMKVSKTMAFNRALRT